MKDLEQTVAQKNSWSRTNSPNYASRAVDQILRFYFKITLGYCMSFKDLWSMNNA